MNDNYTYPAIFDYNEEGVINISFPDFPEAYTFAEKEKDAIVQAQDVLALAIRDHEETGRPVPEASEDVNTGKRQSLVYINVWMPYHRSRIKEIYVKKTLTIPEWLNILAVKSGLNFSSVLTEALKEKLDLH